MVRKSTLCSHLALSGRRRPAAPTRASLCGDACLCGWPLRSGPLITEALSGPLGLSRAQKEADAETHSSSDSERRPSVRKVFIQSTRPSQNATSRTSPWIPLLLPLFCTTDSGLGATAEKDDDPSVSVPLCCFGSAFDVKSDGVSMYDRAMRFSFCSDQGETIEYNVDSLTVEAGTIDETSRFLRTPSGDPSALVPLTFIGTLCIWSDWTNDASAHVPHVPFCLSGSDRGEKPM